MTLNKITEELISIIIEFPCGISQARLAEDLALARAGEPGVALENYCMQIADECTEIDTVLRTRLLAIGAAMGMKVEELLP